MAEVHDRIDWAMFVCTACGEDTYVGRQPGLTDRQFAWMLDRLYGYPRVCTACQMAARLSA